MPEVKKRAPCKPPPQHRALVLRSCRPDMSSLHTRAFKWPEKGHVKVETWDEAPVCGGGLHGWLWGEGDGGLGCWTPAAKWLVLEVDARKVVELNGKVKFPEAWVVFCGERAAAVAYLQAADPTPGRRVIGGTSTSGDGGTISILWWDGQLGRYRRCIGEVGIDGIKANTPYVVVDGKLAEKPAQVTA